MAIAKVAFWLMLVFGILSLIMIPWNPAGLIAGPLYLAVAFGIRGGRAWSAYGMALLTLALTAVPLFQLRQQDRQFGLVLAAGALTLSLAVLLFFAGRALEHKYGRRGLAWPWIAASIAGAAFFLLFAVYQTPTGSMEQTLLVGDHIAVLKTHHAPYRGELVTHYYPVNRNNIFVKRVVAIPGDRVHIANKQLFVNGAAVREPWAEHTTSYVDSYRDNFPGEPNTPLFPQGKEMLEKNVVNGEVVVPPGRYFVLGDNRDSSLDSRYWGFIQDTDIIGTPKFIYYSIKADGKLPILGVRWERMFKSLG